MSAPTPAPPFPPAASPRTVVAGHFRVGRVAGLSLDLDDTLWPVMPAIERAEELLRQWLVARAPAAAALAAQPGTRQRLRQAVAAAHPQRLHDLSFLRQASIEALLREAGEDPGLAAEGFAVFFEGRQQVTLFEDALPALERLARRYPLVSLSNGNADVQRIGLGRYFRQAITAQGVGVAKPDARLFAAAAQALELPAAQVLHIGDDPALDGLGAMQAGQAFAWVHRQPQGDLPGLAQAWPHADQPPALCVADLLALCEVLGV